MKWVHLWNILLICFFGTVHYSLSGNLKKTVGTFWHLTDLHVDREYSRNGDPNDLCHDSGNREYPDNGMYGSFLCDAPWTLVNLTIESMKKIEPEPDFIIWTGDNLPHTRNPDPDWDTTFKELTNITNRLINMFPGVPIYPSIGNHDTFPPNILQPDYNSNNSIYEDYLEKGMWKLILPESSLSTFKHGGFYSVAVKRGLRLISLNTILWYQPNNLVSNFSDPSGQFDWLEKQLRNADAAKDMVYIIGHVPPGFYNRVYPGQLGYSTYHPQFLTSYMDIIKEYSHVIAGQYFAHLHLDTFQIYNYESGQGLSSGLIASSVSPWYSNTPRNQNVSIPVNPSIRLIQYSKTDSTPLNYLQYYLNLSKANELYAQKEERHPEFELLYSFTEAYEVTDLSSKSLAMVFEKLKSSPILFAKFYNFLTSGKQSVLCGHRCQAAQLCAMSCTSSEHYHMCMRKASNGSMTTSPGSFFSLSAGTLTTALIIGFICVTILILGAFFVYHYRKKIPFQKEYISLSSL